MRRGWSTDGLKVVGDDPKLWTVAEAACHLVGPVLSVEGVRKMISLFEIEPVGRRRTSPHGTSGRYARVYRAVELIDAHDTMSRRKRRVA